MHKFLFSAFLFFCFLTSSAQKGLPSFNVSDAGNGKVRIEWVNQFNDGCIQLNIQMSYDGLNYFRTIFSTLSPELPRNGFVYNAPNANTLYYRIFYVLTGGSYYFTEAKQITSGFDETGDIINNEDSAFLITVRNSDSVIATLSRNQFLLFRDSITNFTKDSLFLLNEQEVLLKKFNIEDLWIPSIYIYTDNSGDVKVNLPEAKQKKYFIEIFDEDHKKLFSFHKISDTELIIEKVNFVHAGWYYFELYEQDKLVEKNKFYLARDF